jgi:hypothetical protein
MELGALQELISRARASGLDVNVVEGKGDAAVGELEEQLRLRFPGALRSFYGTYEYLQVGTQEFVWLKDMTTTLEEVHARHPDLPRHYLPVLADGFGGHYYVVCVERGQAQSLRFGAVVYNPAGAAGVFETVSPDVLDFVASKVNAEIEEAREG